MGRFDYLIVVGFLVFTGILGFIMRVRKKSASDYFISKGSLPGVLGPLVIGLSLAATYFSGISFLSIPSVVCRYGLVIIMSKLALVVHFFILFQFFVPRFLRNEWNAPYEIIENRFGYRARKTVAVLYVAMRIGWMAAVIYAPTVAILGMTKLDYQYFWPIILGIGIGSTIYSASIGLRGIMVADALQMLIILGGSIITVGYIWLNSPISFSDSIVFLKGQGTLRVFDFSTDLSISVTTWSVLIAGILNNCSMYYGDQMSLQRYMSASSVKDVRNTFLVNCVAVTVVFLFLCGIGVSLSLWAGYQDAHLLPADTDKIFPYFISSQLPAGLAGLILSALLAATISSVTSGINALSGAVQMDLSERILKQATEKQQFFVARSLTVLFGIIATLLAGFLSNLGQIFDIVQKIVGLFAAPIATTMIFAVLSVKISGRFVVTGLISGCLAGAACALSSYLNTLWSWYPVIGSMWTGTVAMAITVTVFLIGAANEKAGKHNEN